MRLYPFIHDCIVIEEEKPSISEQGVLRYRCCSLDVATSHNEVFRWNSQVKDIFVVPHAQRKAADLIGKIVAGLTKKSVTVGPSKFMILLSDEKTLQVLNHQAHVSPKDPVNIGMIALTHGALCISACEQKDVLFIAYMGGGLACIRNFVSSAQNDAISTIAMQSFLFSPMCIPHSNVTQE